MSIKRKLDEAGEAGEEFVRNLILGVPLAALVKLPGLIVLQYLCFWNWKRIVDPDSRQVFVAGIAIWSLLVATVVVVVILREVA